MQVTNVSLRNSIQKQNPSFQRLNAFRNEKTGEISLGIFALAVEKDNARFGHDLLAQAPEFAEATKMVRKLGKRVEEPIHFAKVLTLIQSGLKKMSPAKKEYMDKMFGKELLEGVNEAATKGKPVFYVQDAPIKGKHNRLIITLTPETVK